MQPSLTFKPNQTEGREEAKGSPLCWVRMEAIILNILTSLGWVGCGWVGDVPYSTTTSASSVGERGGAYCFIAARPVRESL